MAFYAELKRRRWYKVVEVDMISFYRKKLYDDWYASLTPEEIERLEEYRKKQREKRQREAEMAIRRLAMTTATVAGACYRSNHNRYHGVYDEFGFPKI